MPGYFTDMVAWLHAPHVIVIIEIRHPPILNDMTLHPGGSSLRAGFRTIFVLTSLANTRAGQSERRVPPVPIRTPEWPSRLSGQKANSIHTAARHN